MAAPSPRPSPSPAGTKNVPEMVLARIAASANNEAFQYPPKNGGASAWESMTWGQVGERVKNIAGGLRALGLKDEDRGAVLSGTRIEWILADLGILCAGGATTTVYPQSTPEDAAYILQDSGTVIVFAENADQVAKLRSQKAGLPAIKSVVVFDGAASDNGWVITLAELETKGKAWHAANPGRYEEIIHAVRNDSLATLIYTSGTTGKPKGVELTQDCWVYMGEVFEKLSLLEATDKQYLWLPLAHVFGKVLQAGQIALGFPSAVDGRHEKIVENLGIIKPTFVAAVPRIFEKAYNKMIATAKEGGALKWSIFQWGVKVGKEVAALKQKGQKPSGLLALQAALADKLVWSKIKNRFGGKLRFFVSGSAPLSRELQDFFAAMDVLILEGYGMTESSAATCVNLPHKYKFGTVGPSVPGTQVKIAPEDGEILIKGRGVMRGYHNLPEATRETLTADGWLKSGDIGEVDPDGFLRITDRKKDLIKTSGGKYVAPQSIEGKLKAACPFVSQVLVHGNNRNFVTALLTLDEEAMKKWARESGREGKGYNDLVADPAAKDLVKPYIDELNKTLGPWEQIKKFAVLPRDFTVESGEITPSMKVKRKVVETKYKDLLDGFYAGATAGM